MKEELKKAKVETGKIEELRRRARAVGASFIDPNLSSASTPASSSSNSGAKSEKDAGTKGRSQSRGTSPGLHISVNNVPPPRLSQNGSSSSNFVAVRAPYRSWTHATSYKMQGTDKPTATNSSNSMSGTLSNSLSLMSTSGSLSDCFTARVEDSLGFYFTVPHTGHLEVFVRVKAAQQDSNRYMFGVLDEWPTSLCDFTACCEFQASVSFFDPQVTQVVGSDAISVNHLNSSALVWSHHAWANPERGTHFAKDAVRLREDEYWTFSSASTIPQGSVVFISAGVSLRTTITGVMATCWNNSSYVFSFPECLVRVNRSR
jgi:hypothetical protein